MVSVKFGSIGGADSVEPALVGTGVLLIGWGGVVVGVVGCGLRGWEGVLQGRGCGPGVGEGEEGKTEQDQDDVAHHWSLGICLPLVAGVSHGGVFGLVGRRW